MPAAPKKSAKPAKSTAASILSELKKKGSEKMCAMYARHGMGTGSVYGVSMADLKVIAKKLKGQQALAHELFESGNLDAMYLAGMIASGAQMSAKQLHDWAEGASAYQMISEYTVPWVAVEHPEGRALALEWMKSKNAAVAASGWCTYSGLVATMPDAELDSKQIESLLATIVKEVHSAPNRVRYTMNNFVIAVGTYVMPLSKQAKSAARQIGPVSVDMGDTACEVRSALDQIAKVETAGRAGKKRATIRC